MVEKERKRIKQIKIRKGKERINKDETERKESNKNGREIKAKMTRKKYERNK